MWDEECESAVVVEPPDVDVSASLLGLELLDGLDDVVVQSVTVVTPVQAKTDFVVQCPLDIATGLRQQG